MKSLIYFDNSATTELAPPVLESMMKVMRESYGNPSSLHILGSKAELIVTEAREVISRQLGCSASEILFTSGGTEANNLAIQGVARQYMKRGRHLITTAIEHPSVLEVFNYLEDSGFRATYLSVDRYGRIDLDELKSALDKDTILVSIGHVNSEVGSIQPIEQIGEILKSYPKAFFHVDAVQSFGKLDLAPAQQGIDLLTASAHKVHGPKGAGFLYKRKNMMLGSVMFGGDQEQAVRPGTPSVVNIAGMAKAVSWSRAQSDSFLKVTSKWRQEILDCFAATLKNWNLNGDPQGVNFVPYIFNLSFPGIKAEVLIHALAEHGVIISSKSACSSKLEAPSKVLKALGLSDAQALSCVRVSMGYLNKESDIQGFINAFQSVVPMLQKYM